MLCPIEWFFLTAQNSVHELLLPIDGLIDAKGVAAARLAEHAPEERLTIAFNAYSRLRCSVQRHDLAQLERSDLPEGG